MQAAYEKTNEELWSELTVALAKVRRANMFGNRDWWDNGRLVSPAEETQRIYNGLSPELKAYVGDLPEMVSLSKQETTLPDFFSILLLPERILSSSGGINGFSISNFSGWI